MEVQVQGTIRFEVDMFLKLVIMVLVEMLMKHRRVSVTLTIKRMKGSLFRCVNT